MHKLINKIVEKQLSDGAIEQKEISIYQYGYLLLFETMMNIVAGIVVGVLFQQLCAVILFWIGYIPLRSYAGGWHASTFFRCFLASNIGLIMAVIVIKNFDIPVNAVSILVDALSIFIIYMCAPVDTKSKPLDVEEKKKYKRMTLIILVTHIVVSILWCEIWEVLICVHVLLTIATITQYVMNKIEGKKETD